MGMDIDYTFKCAECSQQAATRRASVIWKLMLSISLTVLLACCAARRGKIMSWEAYSRLGKISTPKVLDIKLPAGRLLYFGAEHTNDPTQRQFAEIERLWDEVRPTVALSEGGIRPLENSREQAIMRHGEPGLVRFLAARDGVAIQSLEPEPEAEVAWLRRRYLAEQIKVFYVLRQVVQHRRMNSPEPIENYVARQLAGFSKIKGLEERPNTVAELQASVARVLPELKDWRQAPADWFVPTTTARFTNRINRVSSDLRNEHMVRLLTEHVRRGERVFAVVGFSHVVVQEPSLRARLR